MPGTPLAEAFVRVRALTDRFKPDIERGLAGLGDQFGKQFAREVSAGLKAERGQFEQAGQTAGQDFGRQLAEAGAVRFRAEAGAFLAAGRQVGDDAGAAAGQAFGRRFTQDANGRWHDERGRFVSAAEATGEEAGRGFSRGFQRGSADAGGLGDIMRRVGDLGRQALEGMLPSLGKLTAGLGSTLTVAGSAAAGVATLGAAAASSAGFVTVLAAELAPVSGLLAALPGVLLTGAAALTTWKLATYGVGSAMAAVWSGDAKALEAALAKLTDSGRQFVAEFEKAQPAFKSFQEAAQEGFFSQLSGSLAGFAQALGTLKQPLRDLASEFGGLVREGLNFATAGRTVEQFGRILGNTGTLVGALRAGLQPLLKGFIDLGAVGSNWLAGMSGGLTDVITKFGQWMTRMAESGKAMAWMDNALLVLKSLGSIAKDVGDILTGIFKAARDAGTGALGVLGQLVDKFAQWVNSAQGQQVLVTVFQALDQVGRALTPVITALGGAIAAIAPEAAKVATALGPVLADAIRVLGAGIAALGPGLVTMVGEFGRMIAAIGPLTPLGAALGDVFAALGGALALIIPQVAEIALALAPALAAALKALAPALAALGPGLVAIAEYLGKAFADPAMQNGLLQLGKGIADVLIAAAPLLPVIAELAGILAQVLGGALTNLGTALGPIIIALADALEPALRAISDALNIMIPFMEPIYKAFGDIGAALITELLPPLIDLIPVLITSLIPAFAQLARDIQPLIPLLADLAVQFVKEILPAIIPMIPELSKLSLEIARMGVVLSKLVADVKPYIDKIIEIFQFLYDRLVGHSIIPDLIGKIGEWIGKLPGMFSKWFGEAKDWAIAKFNELLGWIGGLPGRITSALGNMGSLLWNSGRDLAVGLWNGLVSMQQWLRDSIYNFFSGIMPQWVKDALGIASPSKLFAAIGKQLPAGLAVGMEAGHPMLRAASHSLAGVAADAFPVVGPFTSATAAPAFSGTFGGPTAAAAPSTGRGVTIQGDFVVHVQGVIDPNNPVSARRFAETIREQIRQLEREAFQG
jgi:phage-related protein